MEAVKAIEGEITCGERIRQLKSEKADAEIIKGEVDKMINLKKTLAFLTRPEQDKIFVAKHQKFATLTAFFISSGDASVYIHRQNKTPPGEWNGLPDEWSIIAIPEGKPFDPDIFK